jgi:hypothetical protein
MPKYVTCISRNAREYCSEWAEGRALSSEFHWDTEQTCRKTLCSEVLSNARAWEESEQEPMLFTKDYLHSLIYKTDESKVAFWIFKGRVYEETHCEDFSLDQRKLLILEKFDRERVFFEKLAAKFTTGLDKLNKRTRIPTEVRIFVWQRDGGKCITCDSNENLEYDHIIPFSKGGSNTERNLQLLCSKCNLMKSDKIQ